MSRKRKLILWLAVVGIVGIILFVAGMRISAEDIVTTIRGFGPWGPVVFILLTLTTHVVAPISGTPVFIAGWLIFGRQILIYAYIAGVFSEIINFWLARFFGQSLVAKLVGAKNMEKVNAFTMQHGLKTLIFLRLFVGSFHDFISYAYGLTSFKFKPYLLVSMLAPLPFSFFWYFYVADRITNLSSFTLWYVGTGLPFVLAGLWFLRKMRGN